MGKFQWIYRRRILISFLLLVDMQPTNAGFFFSPAIHFPFYFFAIVSLPLPHKNFLFLGKPQRHANTSPDFFLRGRDQRTTVMNGKTPPLPRPRSNYCIVFLITTHPGSPPSLYLCTKLQTLFLFGGPHCHRFCFFWGRGRGVVFLGGPKGGRRGGGGPDSSFPTELLITFSTLYLPG